MTYLLLVNLVLAITALEAVCLLTLWYVAGRGVNPRHYLANLCSGMALMLALRAAVLQDHWTGVAAFLLLAGFLHLYQLRLLFRRPAAGHPGQTEIPRHAR